MIRTTNVRDGFIDTDNVRYVEEATFGRWTRRAVPLPGDVVLTREAPLGEVGIIRKPEPVFLGQRLVMYRAAPDKLDPYFLMYSMRGEFIQGQIRGYGSGSTVEHMRLPDCFNLRVPLPPLGIQRKLAAILSAYDDLIDNNNRRIKILEEMGQRIYREWFVDFRYPGHEDVPLVDSEFGVAPEGWETVPLSMILQHYIGGGWGDNEPSQTRAEQARVIRGTDIPKLRRLDVATCPTRHHSKSSLKSRLLICGDIIVEVSGGSKGQPVGRALLVTNEMLEELGMPTICASFCKLLRCDRNKLVPEILIHRLIDAYATGELETYQVQSTGITNLRFAQLLSDFAVVLPPKALQEQFGKIVASNISLAASLGRTVRNLRAARDLLLPRLVSGVIDVSNLDIATPELAA